MRFCLLIFCICFFNSSQAQLQPIGDENYDDFDVSIKAFNAGFTGTSHKKLTYQFEFSQPFYLGENITSQKNCQAEGWQREAGSFMECWNNQSDDFINKLILMSAAQDIKSTDIVVNFTLTASGQLSDIELIGIGKSHMHKHDLTEFLMRMRFGIDHKKNAYPMSISIHSSEVRISNQVLVGDVNTP